jgi:hypothetical protein
MKKKRVLYKYIEREIKLKAVSTTVWICWKAMITEMTIKKECTILKIILTIYIAPASLKDSYLLPLQCNTLRRSNEYDRFTTTP